MNTRDSTETVTDTHWMNGTSRHNSDPNTQWSINVYMTVKGRQKTHTKMSENDRLQMKMPVTLIFSLRRVMIQIRPMFPKSPRTMVTLYHTTRHPVRTEDIWHCSSRPRTKRFERRWVSFPGHSCTKSRLVRPSSNCRECGEVELFKGRERAVIDGKVWLVLSLRDISPGLQYHQPPGSNCPSQPSENMHLRQRERTHKGGQKKKQTIVHLPSFKGSVRVEVMLLF